MATSELAGVPVLILKEGASRSRGREAQRANIMAAQVVAEAVKTALGPKGMDKMLVDSLGDVTITSDGRTILDQMEIEHPAAKMMVEVAKTQDDEVGDGTTTAVIIAGELLAKAEELMEKKVHPTIIIDGYRKAADKALETLEKIAIPVEAKDTIFLKKVAMTAMGSKLVAENRELLGEIASSAILSVAQDAGGQYTADLDDIKVEKKPGESLADTRIIKGIVLSEEVTHPGMPKRVSNAKILLLSSPLEIKKTEFDAKINIESPEQMEVFLHEEEKMLQDMVDSISKKDVNVLACQKGIDDVAQHFLARRDILAVKQVKESDIEKLAKATGAKVITNLEDMTSDDLGHAGLVEEHKIGDDKMVFIEECKSPHSVSILIRGGTERIVDEAERSIHDALCVTRDVIQEPNIVAGGGAPEMEVAKILKEYANTLPGREQLAMQCFAEAMEAVPLTLAENAGLDPIDILSELRMRHEKGETWAGVGVLEGRIQNMADLDIYEPLVVKEQIIKSATEAASMIIKVDDIIAVGKTEAPSAPPRGSETEDEGEGF